jgi:hypothetical protein
VSQELRRLTVTQELEREELPSKALCGGGQPFEQSGPQCRVGVPLGWGGDDVYRFGVPVVELTYNMVKLGRLDADAGHRKFSFDLGEQHVGLLGPERRKEYCYPRYFR